MHTYFGIMFSVILQNILINSNHCLSGKLVKLTDVCEKESLLKNAFDLAFTKLVAR
jgi:hypothetical protein